MSPEITLLGTVQFRWSDGTVLDAAAVPTTKALDLLRLLVAAEGQERGADHYIHVLWPTADPTKGRMSLRTAVAQLRRTLGPDAVRRAGDLLSLGDVGSDVSRLRRAAATIERYRRREHDAEVLRLAREIEECCGSDLVVSSASCEGVYALREELRGVRGRALLDGAEAAARLGVARESQELAQRAHELLGNEASARALMAAWASLGETRHVIETFERLRANLEAAYGVQPSPETRALYLQVVTAGDGLTLRPAEHHRDVVVDLAATVIDLVDRDEPGGVVWLHGEPGSGRGAVAREAVRLLQQVGLGALDRVVVLPEVIALDDLERQRLRRESQAEGTALLVPVRRAVGPDLGADESAFTVPALDRTEFGDLLAQLLQERPSRVLEERLWVMTGGLAGHVCRTVSQLVHQGQLRWGAGEVGLAPRGAVRRPRSGQHGPARQAQRV